MLFLPSCTFSFPAAGRPDGSNGPIEPDLQRALAEAASDDELRVIVRLRERADLGAAIVGARDAADARARLVSELQATAARSQASLRSYLDEAQDVGLVESYTSFWILNGIAVRARPAVVRTLAAHRSVAAVRLDHYRQWLLAETSNLEPQDPDGQYATRNTQHVEWNIDRVRAPQVWSSLHISGTGAVVAGMDTGVDWLHPALQASYRGYNPHGPSNHIYNWYDATEGGARYPVDGHGHGTHTMGTVVGRDGIGAAPGARWIGVKVLNNQGFGYDSWIHAGFQWILAPGGDPLRAPDVVNCSWGNDNGNLTTFQPDLRALRAAGIFAVFAAGNEGPKGKTIDSPASLPEAFAVGASDEYDEVANFSSRGPSPWGEIRPHVVAPGVHVRSSTPGGAYDSMNGTSMAAPHVSAVAAMLRSVSPTVSITRTAHLITSTAVPLGGDGPHGTSSLASVVPNNAVGWGRVDAFAAVSALAQPGIVTGTVRDAVSGAPVSGARVTASSHGGEGGGTTTSGADGNYLLALAPGVYDLTVSAFGYEPATAWGVVVAADATAVRSFALAPLPTGSLRVRVTDADSHQPISATVAVLDTPYEVATDTHTFNLPSGAYALRAARLGYRVVTATAVVTAGQVSTTSLALPAAASILLVDSGGWYYGSQASYFRQALDDLSYAYDECSIRHFPEDVPQASDLTPYDVVVWSAPEDAPGYIGAQDTITGYLSSGGRMLLSGQDVGFWDGGGAIGYWSDYYEEYLKSRFVSDNAPSRVLEGLGDDIFAGLAITIAGPGGADNQDYPDVISAADPDAAAPLLAYQGGGCGGLRVGTCLDYRAVYLSFGFEAINDRHARREVMRRALDWLSAPPPDAGLELTPASQPPLGDVRQSSLRIGRPGSVVTHALRVRHVGQRGVTDTVRLTLERVSWDTHVSQASLSLSPCTSATVAVSVTIPATATWDVRDVVTVKARSSLSPPLTVSATLTTKTPAPILLVDDDRWYEQREKYEEAMAGADLPYDLWETAPAFGDGLSRSPSVETLQRYPVVVWWTGYDWYQPVTVDEQAELAAYLRGGGRLFLSSQDFLYYHYDEPFSREFLGVLTYTEDVTPTVAGGVPEDPIGGGLGPWPLTYPRGYQNWSDGVEPMPGTAVSFRDQGCRGLALSRRDQGYATSFFAFPFEALPEEARPTVMERAVGWLSWLGRSTLAADRGATAPGDVLTYTLRVQNDGPTAVTVAISNTLPISLSLVPDSVVGPGSYDPSARRLSWSGPLHPGGAVTFTYRATVAAGAPLSPIVNTAVIELADHLIRFHRESMVRLNAPDLSPSSLACEPSLARPGAVVTCALVVLNAGPADARAAAAEVLLPTDASLHRSSPGWTREMVAGALDGGLRWSGPLDAGDHVTLTYQLVLPRDPTHPPLHSVAFLEDGVGGEWERPTWLVPNPWRAYLPVVLRSADR